MGVRTDSCPNSALTYHFSVEAGRGFVQSYAADFYIGAEKYARENHKVSIPKSRVVMRASYKGAGWKRFEKRD